MVSASMFQGVRLLSMASNTYSYPRPWMCTATATTAGYSQNCIYNSCTWMNLGRQGTALKTKEYILCMYLDVYPCYWLNEQRQHMEKDVIRNVYEDKQMDQTKLEALHFNKIINPSWIRTGRIFCNGYCRIRKSVFSGWFDGGAAVFG